MIAGLHNLTELLIATENIFQSRLDKAKLESGHCCKSMT
jgi:hypothetical protein